jgi:O-antigen/teichoic acid export membrane protein
VRDRRLRQARRDVAWDLGHRSRRSGGTSRPPTVAGLTLLVTPLIDWVLTPVFARGAVRSREDLFAHIRQATEPILAVAIPASLFISVGADLWLRLLFGHAYAPATLALRILAASSVVIYVAIVYALTLIMLERAWTLTLISVAVWSSISSSTYCSFVAR